MEKFEMRVGDTAEFPDGTVLKAVLSDGGCRGCVFNFQCWEKGRGNSVRRLMGPCLVFDRAAKDSIKFVSVAAQNTRKAYVPYPLAPRPVQIRILGRHRGAHFTEGRTR